MKLIKLTSRFPNSHIYINVNSIEHMCETDTNTIVGVSGKEFMVKETVEQIIHIIETKAVSSGVVMNG